MKKRYITILLSGILNYSSATSWANPPYQKDPVEREVLHTMQKAAMFFRNAVATHGGYLFAYKSDLTLRQGEEAATPSTIWVQPPGTPAVGMAFLRVYNITGDTMFLNGAIDAARALVWGQLATGGWDYRIDFDPVESQKWHYHRDFEKGDTIAGKRRNQSTLDDRTTQSALQLLMNIDKTLHFKDAEIHRAAIYGLGALLKVQYPNGAWPQRFRIPPDPEKFPVVRAHYPASWDREYKGIPYDTYYTFNDNTMADVIATMIEAYTIYGDERYLDAARRCGDFIILAQMPEPQPAWAQQYNANMEPAWARRFEPPSISGGESFGVMQILLNLYLQTGEKRFLEPVPKALRWAENSLLPDKRLARFYELKTNKPLYFNAPRQYSNLPEPAFPNLKDYTLIYEDTDLPNHYAFKVSGTSIDNIRSYYNRILKEGREAINYERSKPRKPDQAVIRKIIDSLDDQGRWTEKGRIKTTDKTNPYVDAEIISCQTFIRNLSLLSDYLLSKK